MNNPQQPWWLTWPTAELAATILPLFSNSRSVDEEGAMASILSWCRTGSYRQPPTVGKLFHARGLRFDDPEIGAIAEAIQVLEHAGLLMRGVVERLFVRGVVLGRQVRVTTVELGLTRLGVRALHSNTVRQHLGLGGAPTRPNPGGGGTYEPPAL